MRSRKRLLLATTVLATALAAGIADAAPPAPGAAQPNRSSSQFALHREDAGGVDAGVARQRARAGDCAGALPAFDAAIHVTIEPTLRRDRGLCHEKLDHPYPAIDDYRAYVSARPDAPDADQIRDRLSRLEESVGVGAPSAASFQERDESLHAGGSFSLGTQGGKTAGSTGSSAPKARARREREDDTLGPRPGEAAQGYDYYAARERIADASESSPLRFGTGWIVGPFLGAPRYFVGDVTSTSAGAAIGGTFRYAWSSSLTFISELAYVTIGETGQPSSMGGALVFAGFELRVPLDTWGSNHIILGAGPDFEHYTTAGTRLSANVLAGRGRVGYRHVFGPSVGLEFTLDGGPAYVKPDGFDGKIGGLVGGAVAFVVGF